MALKREDEHSAYSRVKTNAVGRMMMVLVNAGVQPGTPEGQAVKEALSQMFLKGWQYGIKRVMREKEKQELIGGKRE